MQKDYSITNKCVIFLFVCWGSICTLKWTRSFDKLFWKIRWNVSFFSKVIVEIKSLLVPSIIHPSPCLFKSHWEKAQFWTVMSTRKSRNSLLTKEEILYLIKIIIITIKKTNKPEPTFKEKKGCTKKEKKILTVIV